MVVVRLPAEKQLSHLTSVVMLLAKRFAVQVVVSMDSTRGL